MIAHTPGTERGNDRLYWKVCGITRPEDAACAVEAGADAVGFVFWPGSPRAVAIDAAARIAGGLTGDVSKVGVFVDPGIEELLEACERCALDFVQLSGDESPEACAAAPRPAWKALRLAPGTSSRVAEQSAAAYPERTLVVDAGVPGAYGGTGERADWEVAAALAAHRRVLLAGGLRGDNVAAAVEQVRPWGVDVSSGVESAPGIKDPHKLTAFGRALEAYR